jgi:MFS family permease
VGFIAAASTVVGIVVSIPAGILSDRIGRRRVLTLSLFVFATAPFLYLLVSSPWQLVLVRIYHGLATAILGPVAMATVADLYDAGRGEKMAWYSSATMVGRFLAPTVGGLLIFGNDFRWVYLVDGIAGMAALLAMLRLPRLTRPNTPG